MILGKSVRRSVVDHPEYVEYRQVNKLPQLFRISAFTSTIHEKINSRLMWQTIKWDLWWDR